MKVGFVFSSQNVLSPKKPLQYQEEAAFGISYISALLKQEGHSTRLLVLSREAGQRTVERFIEEFSPEVLGFTAVASEYPFIADWAKKIKSAYPEIFLIGGGCHISLNPEEGLSSAFDALCIGEGEYPMRDLVRALALKKKPEKIANLWIKQGSTIEKNPAQPFLENLDILPFPDRSMWQEWVADSSSRPAILLGRGCPFQCSYCSNHALSRLAPGTYVRFRSPENIIRELDELVKASPMLKEVYFEVETLSANPNWALQLCKALTRYNESRAEPVSFGTNLRVVPRLDFEPLFAALKQSNFRFINIGLESGSERIRKDVMKRYYSNQDVLLTAQLARKYGIKVHLLNMLGLPEETEQDIRQTININRLVQPDLWPSHSIFFPYAGTEIYNVCRDKSLLPENIDKERERSRAVLNLPQLSKKKIQHYFIWFDYYVYKGHRPLWKLLLRALIARLHASYCLMRIYRAVSEAGLLKGIKNKLKG